MAPAVAGSLLALSGLAIAVTAALLERRTPETSRVIASGTATASSGRTSAVRAERV